MRTNRIYGLCTLQLIGLGVQVINRMAGNFIIFICSAGIILYAVKLDIEQRKFKICPKCKMKIPKKTRICPECGYQYGLSVRAAELPLTLNLFASEMYVFTPKCEIKT